MQGAAAAGLIVRSAHAQTPAAPKPADLKVAIVGTGSQGRNLIVNALRIPGVRFVAVCDIWPYARDYAANILKRYDQPVKTYVEYAEMLAGEKDLDAVIVATPDWNHAEQTIAALDAKKHVYCEKEMSNTLEGAKAMVLAARKSGKLLQIGHQRRSNVRYQHALNLIHGEKLLGRITHCMGQWNRAKRLDLGWQKGKELPADDLKRFGYDTMERFRNWRWYHKFGGGAMADLGSHQVDVFSWFLKTAPKSVIASGGVDYYKDREWYDNVLSIYEYQTPAGPVRAFYQVLNTTSYGGFYEAFMGDQGALEISEDSRRGFVMREPDAPRKDWEAESEKVEQMGREAIALKVGETLTPDAQKKLEGQKMLIDSQKPPHQLHLENFFDAIRDGKALTCPGEVGYATAVAILRANDAVAAGKRLEFTADEFGV